MHKIALKCMLGMLPAAAFAGFDWGGSDTCSGTGSFEQQIEQGAVVTVGEIPVGKEGVSISLTSDKDVDIQLFDQATGDKLVQWPDGMLNGAGVETTTYNGVEIEYSGYNGDGTTAGLGNEYIRLTGTTNRVLVMKAYGYAAGYATVNYAWTGTEGCSDGPAPYGSGSFEQYIEKDNVVEVGELVTGLTNVTVALNSDNDVDIQLLDKSTNTQVVQWPNGILSGASTASTTYGGLTIEYSGYNGDGTTGGLGNEYIKVTGTLDRNYVLSAYGYAAGYATVNYAWGDSTDAGTSAFSCSESTTYFPYGIASGDPTDDSIILWTRLEDDALGTDVTLNWQMSTSRSFDTIAAYGTVGAKSRYGYNAKKKITGLDAGTTYYYRYQYTKGNTNYCTAIGRTRTAPSAGADVPVRFTVVSGQDYIGKYWNTYRHMITKGFEADEDGIDFIVHLGDYVYETSGDPAFQATGDLRKISFSDTSGAIRIGAGSSAFYAAQSLDNYYEIYEHYRKDKVLQALHQNYPWYIVWDDHEYSDDYWDDTAQYFDHRDESNPLRKYNSERAYFEWMPLDVGLGDDGELSLPNYSGKKLTANGGYGLYHPIRWGKNFQAMLTDTRNFRPDHAIGEADWNGKVVMTRSDIETALQTTTGDMAGSSYSQVKDKFFGSYVNIDDSQYNTGLNTGNSECANYNQSVKELLITQLAKEYAEYFLTLTGDEAMSSSEAQALGTTYALEAIQGNISAYAAYRLLWHWIQDHSALGDAGGALASLSQSYWSDPGTNAWWIPGSDCKGGGWDLPLELYPEATAYENLPKGLSLLHLGKTSLFSSHGVGARTVIVKQSYDLYSHWRYSQTAGASENIFGNAQEAELLDTVQNSDATWRIVFSQISSIPMVISPQEARSIDNTINTAMAATEASLQAASVLGSWNAKQGLHILDYNFYMNLDGWDGFTNKRDELLRKYDQYNLAHGDQNTVLISGDIHSSWVAKQQTSSGMSTNIYEFTGTSISSGTGKGLIVNKTEGSFLEQLGIEDAIVGLGLDKINNLVTAGYDGMDYVNISDNGYMYVTIDGDRFTNTYYLFDYNWISQNYYGPQYGGSSSKTIDQLNVQTRRYTIENGLMLGQ